MKNSIYKQDRPQLNVSDFSKHKDFSSTLKRAKTSQFLSLKTLTWGAIGIATVAGAILLSLFNPSDQPSEDKTNSPVVAQTEPIATIVSPLDGYDPNYEIFSIDCSKDQTITTKSGSVIFIPAHSLTDSVGNIVEGIADIHYKEYRDQVDIFESGIPMEYDSAGSSYTFESAGMLDIKGIQNDQPLKIAKEKNIDLLFNSTTENAGYSFYNLDQKTNDWNLDSQSIPVFNPNTTEKAMTKKTVKTNAVASIKMPKAPVKQNIKKYSLSVAIDKQKNPELDAYEGSIMEVNESKEKFDPIVYNVQWETAELSKSTVEGNYDLLLSRKNESVKLLVYPVVKDEFYDKAILKYKNDLSDYQAKTDSEDDFDLYAEVDPNVTAGSITYGKVMRELMAAKFIKPTLTSRLIRLTSFGIHNCDRPIISPTQQPRLATTKEIKTDDGQTVGVTTYYVANPNRNAVVTLNALEELRYYGLGETVLWFVDGGGAIGIVPPEQFDKIDDLESLTCSVYSQKYGVRELRELLVGK